MPLDTKHDLGWLFFKIPALPQAKVIRERTAGSKSGQATLGKSGVHFFMGEEKGKKEGEERGEKWKTERESMHTSRELESHRRHNVLGAKAGPWSLGALIG